MIRILLVDDSAVVRAILKQLAEKDSLIEVCGEATNGLQAIESMKQLQPDAIIMDIAMPVMDGIEATKKIASISSIPVFIFSTEASAQISYLALEAGAVDIIQKPDFSLMTNAAISQLFNKIIAIVNASREKHDELSTDQYLQKDISLQKTTPLESFRNRKNYKAIVLGASTGGPQAILEILRVLPASFPIPIIITQHIDSTFDKSLVHWLNGYSKLFVQLVTNTTLAQGGNVYIAPANKHLLISEITTPGNIYISLSEDEALHFLRPSVDKLFFSAAPILKEGCIAVLLTGMGQDGAQGMKTIKDNGGYTIVQDKISCTIFGMPRSAIEIDAVCNTLPLNQIAKELCHCCDVKLQSKGVFYE
jgi:two-component system chemotaxis response regulator CheB